MIVSLLVLLAAAPYCMACTCNPHGPKPICIADQVLKLNSNGSCYISPKHSIPVEDVNLDSNGEGVTTPPTWECNSWHADENADFVRFSFRMVFPVRIEGIFNKEGEMINSVQSEAFFVTGADSGSCGTGLGSGPSFLAGGTFDRSRNRIEGDMCDTTIIEGADFDAVKRAMRDECATGSTAAPPLAETT